MTRLSTSSSSSSASSSPVLFASSQSSSSQFHDSTEVSRSSISDLDRVDASTVPGINVETRLQLYWRLHVVLIVSRKYELRKYDHRRFIAITKFVETKRIGIRRVCRTCDEVIVILYLCQKSAWHQCGEGLWHFSAQRPPFSGLFTVAMQYSPKHAEEETCIAPVK